MEVSRRQSHAVFANELRSETEQLLEETEPEQRGRPRPLKEQAEVQEHHLLLHELKQELHDEV